jgi:hypothetical protein
MIALGLCAGLASMVQAEGRYRVGYGVLFTNDVAGDTEDRWRSGSVASSRVWADGWTGQAPDRFGDLIEFRFNGEIITPENLARGAPNDRPFAGALGFGLHTHFEQATVEVAAGADLVFTGPQTGLDDFQEFIHDIFGGNGIGPAVRRNQIDNSIYPSAVLEAGRSFDLGPAQIRPFAEARLGLEDLVRDPVTGQRYRVVRKDEPGTAFILGGDIAYVDSSEFLPASSGVTLSEDRARLRGGFHWEGTGGGSLFYGVTWLSEEFEEQREGQVVGSVQFRLRF